MSFTEATPALAGFRLVNTKDPSKPEGQGELIKDSTTGFVVPAEMGLDFTFTAVPESPCVTAVQFLLFDNKGTFIDWDTFRCAQPCALCIWPTFASMCFCLLLCVCA